MSTDHKFQVLEEQQRQKLALLIDHRNEAERAVRQATSDLNQMKRWRHDLKTKKAVADMVAEWNE